MRTRRPDRSLLVNVQPVQKKLLVDGTINREVHVQVVMDVLGADVDVRIRDAASLGGGKRGVAFITPRRALRRGNTNHPWTDGPALATFTVRQSAVRAVLP